MSGYVEGFTRPVARLKKPRQVVGSEAWAFYDHFWDDYAPIRELGRGASGIVYLVGRDGKQYALKVFRDDPENEVETLVLQELSKDCEDWFLNHVATYTILDPRTFTRRKALLMEYFPGVPPDTMPLRPAQVRSIAEQLLRALACMHAAGLVHRDIRPDNMLYNGQRAVLVDFGLSCRSRGDDEIPLCSTLPPDGWRLYLAPEAKDGQNDATDIYALGLSLWFLLHPEQLVPIDQVPQTLEQQSQFARDLVKSISENANPRSPLERLVLDMIQVNPTRRPTALQAYEWLNKRSAL